VLVATRSLEDITARLPEVVAVARSLAATRFVLDGEVLALDDQGRPRPFQETASRTAMSQGVHLTPFDLLHIDGHDLVDSPGAERLAALVELVPEEHLVPRLVTADAAEAEAFTSRVLDLGHEGVVVKSLAAPYDAGRRGSAWVKVKPVHTLESRSTPSTWSCSPSSGARADGAAGSPISTSVPATRQARVS